MDACLRGIFPGGAFLQYNMVIVGSGSRVTYGKNRVPRLPNNEMRMILRSLVLTHYQYVTVRQTDRPD